MDSTYLSTMAQIAGVMVGFANLANAIHRPNIHAKEFQLNKIRMILFTELGLITIAVCVLPILFQASTIPEITVIRIISAALFVASTTYAIANTRRVRKMIGSAFPLPAASGVFAFSGLVIGFISALNALEVFGRGNVILVFYLIIFFALLFESFLFLRLINWILSSQDPGEKR